MSKKTTSIVGLLLAALLSTEASSQSTDEKGPTEPAYLYRANVVGIVDGDTIDADIDLGFYIWIRSQRIRLLGINAPEPKGQTKEAGKAATACLTSLLKGKSIIIRTVKGKDGGDRDDSFGRWLGVVYVDGLDVNKSMLEKGCAVVDNGP